MKKTFLISIIFLCVAVFGVVIASNNQYNLSELTKTNIEALTNGGTDSGIRPIDPARGTKPCTGPKEPSANCQVPYCHCLNTNPCYDTFGCK